MNALLLGALVFTIRTQPTRVLSDIQPVSPNLIFAERDRSLIKYQREDAFGFKWP